MWIFCSLGFFSVVRDTETESLMVRARCIDDLVALRAKYLSAKHLIVRTPDRDYPARIFVSDRDWARIAKSMAGSIDYTNFKSSVVHDKGIERARTYHKVWATLQTDLDDRRRRRVG